MELVEQEKAELVSDIEYKGSDRILYQIKLYMDNGKETRGKDS